MLLEVLELRVITVGAHCGVGNTQGVGKAALTYEKVDQAKDGFGAGGVDFGGKAEGLFGFVEKFVLGQETGLGGDQFRVGFAGVGTVRGFWIGKYLVTQGNYLSVTGTNSSYFNGDRSGPPWFDQDYGLI